MAEVLSPNTAYACAILYVPSGSPTPRSLIFLSNPFKRSSPSALRWWIESLRALPIPVYKLGWSSYARSKSREA